MKNESGNYPQFSTKMQPGSGPALYELFLTALRETYWAENHLVRTLPVMKAAAAAPKLKKAITDHLEETVNHVARIEAVFDALSEKAVARKCIAIEGLTKEGEAVIEITGHAGPVRDAGIIMANQKVEHYEIANYSGLSQLAGTLDLKEVSEILDKTLEEEKNAAIKLTEIAVSEINQKAAKAS